MELVQNKEKKRICVPSNVNLVAKASITDRPNPLMFISTEVMVNW
jgi:hypothetical protein